MVVLLEPRISGPLADSCISKIGYARSHRVKANGFSGGISILWQKNWSVEILVNHSQFVHMSICENDNFISFFTAVYAHPSLTIRNRVWPLLQLINDNIQAPWLIMGDFNSLLSSSERRGGSVNRSGICKPFLEWFTNSNLIDIGYKGPDFTWKRGLLHERLDRGLCNAAWRFKFQEDSITHLARISSNHRPLLMSFYGYVPPVKDRPFRFLQAWLSHSDFPEFNWSIEVFEHIFRKKKELLARISGIQRTLSVRQSPFLKLLEVKLMKELEEMLLREELFWFQKSRSDWVLWGDKSTFFFHQKTIRRRKRNRIELLKDDFDV
ncbi:hypothetical protein K2173_028305 [Erythroxylum novogranatense]|uniref:Endonuclease/exonuclease/phosphatase domain-containing protein n=1 Tax=Erythroxylum novogranatense TaxID=1862640 RepID=A0AAV8U1R2_9ROSI|nr:hypothetical protein K2173_028305 [Erythroxylum novogranatense]